MDNSNVIRLHLTRFPLSHTAKNPEIIFRYVGHFLLGKVLFFSDWIMLGFNFLCGPGDDEV